ncbi:MAG: 1-phosphofructokinase family hexose kinase [Anaerolineae bacterium]|nr:1-phosphofructokinase family hexose kinase [Anaerolineae bacterium]
MIYTVSLNPSLDKTLSVPALRLGELNRAQVLRLDLAGKGMNVSRALRALGIDSTIVGLVGGATGQTLRRGLIEAGFTVRFVEVEDESRQNITLFDESSGQYTKINEPGARAEAAHVAAMLALVDQTAQVGDCWAFCGSLPPGAPSDLYAQLIHLVQSKGGRAFLDSSGAALREGFGAAPFCFKPNDEEAAELLGLSLDDETACRDAVRHFMNQGIELIVLTRGAKGLILGLDGEIVAARPPWVDARSPIGAGDATLAGLIWAVSEGCDAHETARRAVACGTAAAMQEGTAVGDAALVQRLVGQVSVI